MIRRILCLVLIPALFANQAAVGCAHTHNDGGNDEHSMRAHIHLSSTSRESHSHSLDHDHSVVGHHVHSDDDESQGSENERSFDLAVPNDHNRDALYFGENQDLLNPSNRIIIDRSTIVSIDFESLLPRVSNTEPQSQMTRAGPFSAVPRAIFLQIHCLLL